MDIDVLIRCADDILSDSDSIGRRLATAYDAIQAERMSERERLKTLTDTVIANL